MIQTRVHSQSFGVRSTTVAANQKPNRQLDLSGGWREQRTIWDLTPLPVDALRSSPHPQPFPHHVDRTPGSWGEMFLWINWEISEVTETDWKWLDHIFAVSRMRAWGKIKFSNSGENSMPEIGWLQLFLVDTQEPNNSAESHTLSNNVMVLSCILCWTLW